MQKFSIKYLQMRSKNISKILHTMSKLTSSLRFTDGSTYRNKQKYHTNRLRDKIHYDHFLRCGQNSTLIFSKSPVETRSIGDIPQHNKGNWIARSQPASC